MKFSFSLFFALLTLASVAQTPSVPNYSMNQFKVQLSDTAAGQRTIADKLMERPSIDDFGANPYDNVDDTQAIRKALRTYKGRTILGPAVFAPGVNGYVVTDTIHIPANTTLEGVGNASYFRVNSASIRGAFVLAGNYAEIRNLKIERTYGLTTAPNGFRGIDVLPGAWYTRIHKVTIFQREGVASTYGIYAADNVSTGPYWITAAECDIVGGEYGIYCKGANNSNFTGGFIQSKYGAVFYQTGNPILQGTNIGGGNNYIGVWLQDGTTNAEISYKFEGGGNGANTEAYRDVSTTTSNRVRVALGGPLGNKLIQKSTANYIEPIDGTGTYPAKARFDTLIAATFVENTWVDTGIGSDLFAYDGFYKLGVVNLENWAQGGAVFNYYALIDLPVVKATNSTETVTLNVNHTSQSNNGDAISWRIQKDAASGTGKFKLQVKIQGASARTYTGPTTVKYRVNREF